MENANLTKAQITAIVEQAATAAADLVFQRIYLEVGKSAFRLSLYVVGAAILAALSWLGLHEKIGIP